MRADDIAELCKLNPDSVPSPGPPTLAPADAPGCAANEPPGPAPAPPANSDSSPNPSSGPWLNCASGDTNAEDQPSVREWCTVDPPIGTLSVVMLAQFVNSMELSDVVLTASDGSKFFAHRVILASASPALRCEVCCPDFLGTISIDSSGPALLSFLEYVYTAHTQVPAAHIEGFLSLTLAYELLPRVQSACEAFLLSRLTTTDVLSYLTLARCYGLKRLESRCLALSQDNTMSVLCGPQLMAASRTQLAALLADRQVNGEVEVEIFSRVVAWGQARCGSTDVAALQAELRPLMQYIAFTKMKPSELRDVVKPLNVLSLEDYVAAFEAAACCE
uniref:BTB domain-containing protein n=1 Tax=Eutreptiella gymnastica TaxID=73025 RepID=A0A7S1N9C8_9EUGL